MNTKHYGIKRPISSATYFDCAKSVEEGMKGFKKLEGP